MYDVKRIYEAYTIDEAIQLKKEHPDLTKDTVTDVVQKSVGQVFARVLEDAGVFKRDEKGQARDHRQQ